MSAPRRHALFLDRDGVINVDKNYVHRIEDFEFVPGIFELGAVAMELGFVLVVVTNQAGIGRGYYTEGDFRNLTDWMLGEFSARRIEIAAVYHCPYHPTEGIGAYRRESFDRKPNPGMILKAGADLGLDLPHSALIGDKESDIAAGQAAGVGHLLMLQSARAEPSARPIGQAPAMTASSSGRNAVRGEVTVVRSLSVAALRLRELKSSSH